MYDRLVHRSTIVPPPSLVHQALETAQRRSANDNFLNSLKHSLKPQLEEVLIAAHRIKGVSSVTTVPHHQATMNTEIDALISKINELIAKV